LIDVDPDSRFDKRILGLVGLPGFHHERAQNLIQLRVFFSGDEVTCTQQGIIHRKILTVIDDGWRELQNQRGLTRSGNDTVYFCRPDQKKISTVQKIGFVSNFIMAGILKSENKFCSKMPVFRKNGWRGLIGKINGVMFCGNIFFFAGVDLCRH